MKIFFMADYLFIHNELNLLLSVMLANKIMSSLEYANLDIILIN